MGFRAKRKVLKLVFQDEDMAGLEVMARTVTTGQLIDLQDSQSGRVQKEMAELFASALVSWNLEDEETGEPIPATLEGVRSLDVDFSDKIINTWTTAIAGVSRPLPQTSSGGQPSVEASIPMETLSGSLAS